MSSHWSVYSIFVPRLICPGVLFELKLRQKRRASLSVRLRHAVILRAFTNSSKEFALRLNALNFLILVVMFKA